MSSPGQKTDGKTSQDRSATIEQANTPELMMSANNTALVIAKADSRHRFPVEFILRSDYCLYLTSPRGYNTRHLQPEVKAGGRTWPLQEYHLADEVVGGGDKR